MKEVISVRFRSGCKNYYFSPGQLTVAPGQDVIVETAQGPEYVTCTQGNHTVEDHQVVEPLRRVLRPATENDRRSLQMARAREKEAFAVCQKKIAQRGLEMKLVRAESSFDGNKLLFFFTADGRVDFRELVKDLAAAASSCARSASGTRRRCWAAWASAAVPSAAASIWTISSPCPSRWPRPKTCP